MKEANILIVEDEAIFADNLKNFLINNNYKVVGRVDNFSEALQIVKKRPVDLVLIDIYLRGKENGIFLAKELKKLDIAFLFITAISDEKTIEIAIENGAYGYIVKPIDLGQLKITLDIALYQIELYRNLKREKEKLQEKLREMVESLQFMMIELDSSFNITYLTSHTCVKFSNLQVGKNFLSFFDENEIYFVRNKLEEVKKGKIITFNFFLRDGENRKVPVFFKCSPVNVKEKDIRIVMLAILDIISELLFADDSFFEKYSLSNREREIIKCIINLNTNQEISKKLFISVSTVKFHIKNIFSKLNIKNRKELLDLLKDYYVTNYGREYYALYLLNILLNTQIKN
jgi:DNA-binding NarL/FixJ family response regulator